MSEKDMHELQDLAFAEAEPFTDEQLAEVLANGGAYITEDGISGPEAYEGWDIGRTNPQDHGTEEGGGE